MVAALVLVPVSSHAQTAPASAVAQSTAVESGQPATVQDLLRALEAQQQLIEEQGRQIEALRREIAETRALLQAGRDASPAPAPVPQTPPAAVARQPATVEQAPHRAPELPPDVVSAGDFPGSFRIPGSDAALKIGGLVRVNWVSTNDALLVDDRFVTSAIPVEGTTESARGARVNVIASPSRFNFDLRTPTGVGHMRAFLEGDFAGDGNTLRLRHAYGQWRRLIFGQTWSTFSDPEAEPDGIDFEGLNAIVLFRQPQIRWSVPLSDRWRLALALEDSRPDLTGATGVNQVPDFVGRARWEPERGGHIQIAAVARQLRGEPVDQLNEIVSAAGYGVNISGRLPLQYWNERDRLLFQHNSGRGLGRYVTDLGSLGGQDGVYDSEAHALRPLDVYSGYVGYEHWWAEQLRSSFSFGIVGVNNLDIQPDDALRLTRRYSVNFMWSPIPRLDLVTEFLWGSRKNKNGLRGSAAQTQIGSTFRF
jgi:hypothetical protein